MQEIGFSPKKMTQKKWASQKRARFKRNVENWLRKEGGFYSG
jgi:hypothetical protein